MIRKVADTDLEQTIDEYSDIDVSDFDFDISKIIKENTHILDNNTEDLDWASAKEDIEAIAINAHLDWIKYVISDLPPEYSFRGNIYSEAFTVSGAETLLESYMSNNYDEIYHDDISDEKDTELEQIDNLFDWDN